MREGVGDMAPVKCFKCGRVNSGDNAACEGCGERLLNGQEYKEKFQELKEYDELRRRYSLIGIIVGILVLLLLYPVLEWLMQAMFSLPGMEFLPAGILGYAAPTIILLVFLIAILPLIFGRWKIRQKYLWTKERMQDLDRMIKPLPKDFFIPVTQGGDEIEASVRKVQGPPKILLAIVFTLLGLAFFTNEYTDLKPVDSIISMSGISNAQTVSGRYDCHLEAANLEGGVMRTDQTWSYIFRSDGTYVTYLNGSQQFSGTWSQSGTILTIHIPAIKGISAAYSSQATVSRDGNSFTAGDEKFIKVRGD